jgi:hypothetical protein
MYFSLVRKPKKGLADRRKIAKQVSTTTSPNRVSYACRQPLIEQLYLVVSNCSGPNYYLRDGNFGMRRGRAGKAKVRGKGNEKLLMRLHKRKY